jgi:hypothetical protein
MVKISYRIGKLSPDDEFEVVETEFEAEPGEKLGMVTRDGSKVINGRWYIQGGATKRGEFLFIEYKCQFCLQKFKLKQPIKVESECICRDGDFIAQRTEYPHSGNLYCTCGATRILDGGYIIKELDRNGNLRCIPTCIKCYKLNKIQEKISRTD